MARKTPRPYHDGLPLRASRTVITINRNHLPEERLAELGYEDRTEVFAKKVKHFQNPEDFPGAVQTDWLWDHDDSPVWAVPLKVHRVYRWNRIQAVDGRVLHAQYGKVYVRQFLKPSTTES